MHKYRFCFNSEFLNRVVFFFFWGGVVVFFSDPKTNFLCNLPKFYTLKNFTIYFENLLNPSEMMYL